MSCPFPASIVFKSDAGMQLTVEPIEVATAVAEGKDLDRIGEI